MIYQADRLFLLMWFIAKLHRANRRKGLNIHFDMKDFYEERDILINELKTIGIAQGKADGYHDIELQYLRQMNRRNIKPVDLDKLGIVRIG